MGEGWSPDAVESFVARMRDLGASEVCVDGVRVRFSPHSLLDAPDVVDSFSASTASGDDAGPRHLDDDEILYLHAEGG